MVRSFALLPALMIGCATVPPVPSVARVAAVAPEASGASVEGAPRDELPWATFSPATFARARAEHKVIVMDGSAEWCHWCHVMEATTYHDPNVRALLARSFIAVKVDVDARPDLAERYADYGWPATVLFSPDANELGKYRGYIAPEKFAAILKSVAETAAAAPASAKIARPAPDEPLAEETLGFVSHFTEVELDEYWDEEEGGWGKSQKAAVAANDIWLLRRGFEGRDQEARRKALFTLDQQARIIDPVWGGIYQYSAARDWDHPHFEKLMTFQAGALETYALAYRYTKDARQLARARLVLGYIERFMRGPEGGFYTTQDADLNAHDRAHPFMDGHAYYALDGAAREARGIPRVDTNEYGRENGLAIGAYVAMYEATADEKVLAAASTAADRILATHRTTRGGITHGPVRPEDEAPKQLFLSDNAAFGWALLRLDEVRPNAVHRAAARGVGDFLLADLADPTGGGLFASTRDPDAVGVFAERRVPFEDNVMALRFLARLARTTKDPRYEHAIARILRAISTPEEIKARGRWLGDYLLALEETRGVRRGR